MTNATINGVWVKHILHDPCNLKELSSSPSLGSLNTLYIYSLLVYPLNSSFNVRTSVLREPTKSELKLWRNVEKLGGLHGYFTGTPDSNLAILLVSDIYGYEAPNLRKLADKVASAGYYVVVPDFIYGDPYEPTNAERPLPVWIKDHGTDKGFEDAKQVIEALKSKGVAKIGAAGFCWGAKVVVELAKSDYIQAAMLLHPSFVTLDDIKAVNAPIAILGAEIDRMSPPELLEQFEEALTVKPEVNSFVKVIPGVAHGWTVRYNVEDAAAVKRAEEAHQNMLDWFAKFIK